MITTKVQISAEMLEAQAVDEISKATRMLLMQDCTPYVQAEALALLADMEAQVERRGPTFRACVDEYRATFEEWSAGK